MDITSGEVITRWLSMPHSPWWYGGRLWASESGSGNPAYIDPNAGKYVPIAEVPGFTRGLVFAGNLAFVGLSLPLESEVFSGIPIIERLTEDQRTCDVCVIDLTSGQVVVFLRFETAVEEVLAVATLPGRRDTELVNDEEELPEHLSLVPGEALADVSEPLRTPAGPTLGMAGSAGNGRVPRQRSRMWKEFFYDR